MRFHVVMPCVHSSSFRDQNQTARLRAIRRGCFCISMPEGYLRWLSFSPTATPPPWSTMYSQTTSTTPFGCLDPGIAPSCALDDPVRSQSWRGTILKLFQVAELPAG